jgi:hypothetical protein
MFTTFCVTVFQNRLQVEQAGPCAIGAKMQGVIIPVSMLTAMGTWNLTGRVPRRNLGLSVTFRKLDLLPSSGEVRSGTA